MQNVVKGSKFFCGYSLGLPIYVAHSLAEVNLVVKICLDLCIFGGCFAECNSSDELV